MKLRSIGIAALVLSLLSSCETLKPKTGEQAARPAPGNDLNVNFLLSMDYAEAKAISARHETVPPYVSVAADDIQVVKTDKQGQPRKLRAKGHVFVQLDYKTQVRALCDEALISDDDVILRGNPVMQRGGSVVEGQTDYTVFYLMGTRLQAIGPHKLTNRQTVISNAPLFAAWQGGSSSLLPPLQDSDVPDSVRNEMRKAVEAETALQKSRAGQPMAFPEAALEKPVPVP